MEKTSRVKILDTDYNKELNLVQWKIQMLEDEKQLVLAWRGSDLGHALGITAIIPPDIMKKFCEDIKGKEINLVMSSEMDQFDADKFANLSPTEMQKISNEMEEKYPFYEVEYLEKKEKEDD